MSLPNQVSRPIPPPPDAKRRRRRNYSGGAASYFTPARTAGPVRLGSTFALSTRQGIATEGSFDEQRYEVQLTPDGEVNVSRPHGEPRYPVRAEVARRGTVLRVEMETLLRPEEGFGWRAESSYLPDFPLGDIYGDAIPNDGRWLRFPASPGP